MADPEHPFDLMAEYVAAETAMLDRAAVVLPSMRDFIEIKKTELAADPDAYFEKSAQQFRDIRLAWGIKEEGE